MEAGEHEAQLALDRELILPDTETSVPWELDEVHKKLIALIHDIPVNTDG